jgi:hypothetical protein
MSEENSWTTCSLFTQTNKSYKKTTKRSCLLEFVSFNLSMSFSSRYFNQIYYYFNSLRKFPCSWVENERLLHQIQLAYIAWKNR